MTPDVAWHGNTVGEINGVDTLVAVLTGFIGALPDIHAEERTSSPTAIWSPFARSSARPRRATCSEFPQAASPSVERRRHLPGQRGRKDHEQWAFEDMAAIGSQLGAFTLPWAG